MTNFVWDGWFSLLITVVNVSIIVEFYKQSHNRRRLVVVEAYDLRMTPVFSTGLLILSNMDPRHICFN